MDLIWYLILAGACQEAVGACRGLDPASAWRQASGEWRGWVVINGAGYGAGYGSGDGSSFGSVSGYGAGSSFGAGCGAGDGYGYGAGDGYGSSDGDGDDDPGAHIEVWDGERWVDAAAATSWLAERAAQMEAQPWT